MSTIPGTTPDDDAVGTLRQEVGEDYSALWLKVNRAEVYRREFRVVTEWLCVESDKVGLNGLIRPVDIIKDFPVVGVLPLSSATKGMTPGQYEKFIEALAEMNR